MYKLPISELVQFLKNNDLYVPHNRNLIYEQVINNFDRPKTLLMSDYLVAKNNNSKPYKSSEIFLYDLEIFGIKDKSRIIRMLSYINALNNDMNVFNLLPNELIVEILLKVDHNSIKSFCLTQEGNIFYLRKLRKLKRYPRFEGKCKVHDIPKEVIRLNNNKWGRESLHECMEKATTLDLDLVRGDVIEFNPKEWLHESQAIYDGEEIIEMGYATGDGYIDGDFEILKDEIPIDYWPDYGDNFKIERVLDQCLNNIKCEFLYDEMTLFTTFVVDCITYKLVYDVEGNLKYKIEFIRALKCGNTCIEYCDKRCHDKYTLFIGRYESVNYRYEGEYPNVVRVLRADNDF